MIDLFEDFYMQLYENYYDYLLNYAKRTTGQDDVAEELVQDTYVTLLTKIETVYNHENPVGWLFRTLQNHLMNELKRSKYHCEIPLDDKVSAILESKDSSNSSKIYEIIPLGFPSEYKDILVYRFELKLEYKDISKKLGLTESACRVRLHRALFYLRKIV